MGRIKRDLGTDAIILQTRQFRDGGFFGLFGKMKVEITAAIEEQAPPVSVPEAPAPPRVIVQEEPAPQQAQDTETLQQELLTLRQMIEKMNQNLLNLNMERQAWSPDLLFWAEYLHGRGMREAAIRGLLRQVQRDIPEEHRSSRRAVYLSLQRTVSAKCANTQPIQLKPGKPCVVAMIGPTGVGKTTTIGKLAAGFSIVDKRKVALITADTYRVAAVEQLKTFGDIIGVPVEVVMAPSGITEALAKHADKELIFIDTAGRSPQNDLHMTELRSLLDKAKPDYAMLVVSATMNTTDILQVVQRFQMLATDLIFSKLDETLCAGNLLTLIEQTGFPVSYITNGQNVPDDIEVASAERLALHLLGGGPDLSADGYKDDTSAEE
jgi:flagellar biosynthesis protein FlhF